MIDSSAWLMQSNPVAATTFAGSVRVTSGSTSATSGISRREMMPVFALSAVSVKIEMPVVSEPVPDVVGHAMCGRSGPGTRCPAPIGALTYVMNSAGWLAYRLAALHVSMTEPPPTDTKPSTFDSRANRVACWNERSVGSMATSS